jgi:hypothetical protein
MDEETVNQFNDKLEPNEKLQWSGKPYSGIHFEIKNLENKFSNNIVPFVILLGLLAIFKAFNFFTDLGFVILIICTFAFPLATELINEIVIQPLIRKYTFYAISNQRIIFLSRFITYNNKSINLNSIKQIRLHLYKNGKGTIQLDSGNEHHWTEKIRISKNYYLLQKNRGPKLELVDDASRVYDFIKELQWKINKEG